MIAAPMRIKVLYFAVFRERLGRDEEEIELADGRRSPMRSLRLRAKHADIAKLRGRVSRAP